MYLLLLFLFFYEIFIFKFLTSINSRNEKPAATLRTVK